MATLAQPTAKKQTHTYPVKWAASVFFGEYSSASLAIVDSLGEALAKSFAEATYYLGHHTTARIKISAVCSQCYGESFIAIRTARTTKRKRCPNCRGHVGDAETIEFDANPHDNVRSIDNGTGMVVDRK